MEVLVPDGLMRIVVLDQVFVESLDTRVLKISYQMLLILCQLTTKLNIYSRSQLVIVSLWLVTEKHYRWANNGPQTESTMEGVTLIFRIIEAVLGGLYIQQWCIDDQTWLQTEGGEKCITRRRWTASSNITCASPTTSVVKEESVYLIRAWTVYICCKHHFDMCHQHTKQLVQVSPFVMCADVWSGFPGLCVGFGIWWRA